VQLISITLKVQFDNFSARLSGDIQTVYDAQDDLDALTNAVPQDPTAIAAQQAVVDAAKVVQGYHQTKLTQWLDNLAAMPST